LCGIEVDNITGVAGKMMGKFLHTNYSKKQNSKFPQSVFKIYNHLLSLFKFIIYNDREMEVTTKCLQKASRGSVSSET